MMIVANNSKPRKRKKSYFEKRVKKEGKKALKSVLKGKEPGHFKTGNKTFSDKARPWNKMMSKQQNVNPVAVNNASVNATLQAMKMTEKPTVITGTTRKVNWVKDPKTGKWKPKKSSK